MVRLEYIEYIINQVCNNQLSNKCGSRAEIEAKLDAMDVYDKYDKLHDVLSKWEYDNYVMIDERLENVEDKDISKFPKRVQEEIESLKELRYRYEKRLITHETSEVEDFNLDRFKEADQTQDKKYTSPLEQEQIDAQNKKLEDINWDLYGDGAEFFRSAYWDMNGVLVEGEDGYWNSLIKDGLISENQKDFFKEETRSKINHLDKLINESSGLIEDTVLYRGGKFPYNLIPGMRGRFPCYSSTSYNKRVADSFQMDGEYMIKIYAPKGTKGLCSGGVVDGSNVGSAKEHEFTLKHGQKFIVLDRKDYNHTVEILLIN